MGRVYKAPGGALKAKNFKGRSLHRRGNKPRHDHFKYASGWENIDWGKSEKQEVPNEDAEKVPG